MPAIVVSSTRKSSVAIDLFGTQTVESELFLTRPSVVELRPSVFSAPGTYTLFTYGTFALNYPTVQEQLNARLTIDGSRLVGLSVLDSHGTAIPAQKKVTVTLVAA